MGKGLIKKCGYFPFVLEKFLIFGNGTCLAEDPAASENYSRFLF
jgi:hypothetical protein